MPSLDFASYTVFVCDQRSQSVAKHRCDWLRTGHLVALHEIDGSAVKKGLACCEVEEVSVSRRRVVMDLECVGVRNVDPPAALTFCHHEALHPSSVCATHHVEQGTGCESDTLTSAVLVFGLEQGLTKDRINDRAGAFEQLPRRQLVGIPLDALVHDVPVVGHMPVHRDQIVDGRND